MSVCQRKERQICKNSEQYVQRPRVKHSGSPVWLTAVTLGPTTQYTFSKYLLNDWCV